MALRCQNEYPLCSYKYDPKKGDPDHEIESGTLLEDIPAGWVCPRCLEDEIKSKKQGGKNG